MPNVVNSSHSFENLVSAIESSSANVIEPNIGAEYKLGNSYFTVLGPVKYDDKELNNNSVVIKLSCGANSALFTGDCEKDEENDIISAGSDISADILKIGHHGSASSTSADFLNEVDPKIAVICVGSDNSYGHPANKTLSSLSGRTVYRTDINGDIIVTMTGNDYFVMTAKTADNSTAQKSVSNKAPVNSSVAAIGTYILNTANKKVHLPKCSAVNIMSDKNKQSYSGSISYLTAKGYTACGICRPF